jgi:hypothetical protein
VAKTLYATKWARPDTCTAIAFITMREQAPDKDDWNKLVHLMKYLRGMHTLPLILRFLQSVSSMAFLYCRQPRLGYVWKICITSRHVALLNVCLCTAPMMLCGLSVLPRVLHTRAQGH